MKRIFIQYFGPFVATFVTSLHSINAVGTVAQATTWDFSKAFERWDSMFNTLLKSLEEKAAQVRLLIYIILPAPVTENIGPQIPTAHERPTAN